MNKNSRVYSIIVKHNLWIYWIEFMAKGLNLIKKGQIESTVVTQVNQINKKRLNWIKRA